MKPGHISTVAITSPTFNPLRLHFERHGLCRCVPQPDSTPIGECVACHRLDARKASA